MDIGLITSVVIGILSKYGVQIVRSAEVGLELVKKLGPAAVQVVRQLYGTVKDNLGSDQKAKKTLELYEEDPKTFEGALKTILQRHLEQDEAFAKELQGLVDAFENVAPPKATARIVVSGSGAAATDGGVAAGERGYAAGRDIHIGTEAQDKK